MLKLTFEGCPLPQQRHRMFRRGNRICSYDPQGLVKHQMRQHVVDQLNEYRSKHGEYLKPIYPCLYFWFLMPIPKSLPKKERESAVTGQLKHIKRPDVDNLMKLYMDVITGLAINDDSSAQIGRAVKLYGKEPRTILFIEETDKLITNSELYGRGNDRHKPYSDQPSFRSEQGVFFQQYDCGDEGASV